MIVQVLILRRGGVQELEYALSVQGKHEPRLGLHGKLTTGEPCLQY